MATLRKSILINFVQNYGIIVLQFIASIILARLLSPADMGIYSVAATLISLAQVVRDFGVGQYIIQESSLTNDRIRSAFTISVISSVILAATSASLCNIAADFYREPGVRNVMLVLSVNFLLVPFGQITAAHLQRDMKFGALATAKIGSAIIHFGTSISLAYFGFSYMSLAYASLAGALSNTMITNFYRPKNLPWSMGFSDIRRVINFGSFSVLSNLANALARGVADLVVGRMINMHAVGLFSRANGLIEIFNQGVMNALWAVALPHFSQAVRDGEDLKNDFLKSTCLITGIAWPFFGVLAILAEPLVIILYGNKWIDCVPLVKWICLYFFIIAPFYLFGSILTAIGEVKKVMWIEICSLPVQFSIYIFASKSGDIAYVAMSGVFYSIVKAIIIYYVLRRHLLFKNVEFLSSLIQSFGAAVFTILCLSIIYLTDIPKEINSFQLILVGGFVATIGWLAGIYLTKHPIGIELVTLIGKRK